ncbi:hypothetical protein [Fusobacterium nucleatum]|uniref:hypothetical protein n=1 Tax=Fusobacterium nucleatum TaxID=851 RepID=UPI0030CBF03F
MSKFYTLVHNIEKLRKEIEDIQKSNDEIKKDKDNEKGKQSLLQEVLLIFLELKIFLERFIKVKMMKMKLKIYMIFVIKIMQN